MLIYKDKTVSQIVNLKYTAHFEIQGIIQKKSVSGSRTLPLVISDQKVGISG